jgi:septal ring factor EnvC (AmiA/AmiB activator)
MRKTILIMMLLCSFVALAQDKPLPPAPNPAPQLTATEKLAVAQLAQELKAAQDAQQKFAKDLQDVQDDFKKAHPGWKFDPEKGVIPWTLPTEPKK